MVNQLGKKTVNAIRRLHAKRWSYRRIARTVSVHPETVGRYIHLGEATLARARTEPVSRSRCVPYREVILAKLERGLSARHIHRDLVNKEGFEGSYSSVKGFVRYLRSGPKRLYFREYYRLTRGNMGRWYLAEIFKDRDTADLDTIVREVCRIASVNFTEERIGRSLRDHITRCRNPWLVEYAPHRYKIYEPDIKETPNRPLLLFPPEPLSLICSLACFVLTCIRRRRRTPSGPPDHCHQGADLNRSWLLELRAPHGKFRLGVAESQRV